MNMIVQIIQMNILMYIIISHLNSFKNTFKVVCKSHMLHVQLILNLCMTSPTTVKPQDRLALTLYAIGPANFTCLYNSRRVQCCAVARTKSSIIMYTLHGKIMRSLVSLRKDLGVMRSSNGSYTQQCHMVVKNAAKMAEAMRRIFRCKRQYLMWTALRTYVNPYFN